jgi:hypothetical protein
MSELPYEGKKYTKTEQGWVEKKSGELASPDYQTLLSKLESAMGSGNKTPLPSASPSTESTISTTPKDDKLTNNFDKLETKLAKLTASIDKLVKSLDKTFRPNSQKNVSSIEAPSQNIPIPKPIPKPGIIPAVGRAVNNGLFSQRDPETGKTTSTGLVRKFATTMFPGVANAAYAVRDQYKMAQILNKNQTATPATPAKNQTATPAKSRMASIASNLASKFSAKAATEEKEATKQSAVDLTDNTIKKIADAVKGDKKEDSILQKIIDKVLDVVKKLVGPIISAISKLLGVFGGIGKSIGKLFGFGGGTKAASTGAEIVKDAAGKSRYAKGAVDATGKKIGGQFVKTEASAATKAAAEVAENAIKKPTFLAKTGQGISKLFGGAGAKVVEKEGIKVAEKAGLKAAEKQGLKILGKGLLKSGLKKIPGVGLIAGGAFAAGRALKGDFAGAGLELASGAAGTIPGIGTAASIGIDAALAAKDMGAFGGGGVKNPAEAVQGPPVEASAVPVKPKTSSKFGSITKALGKGALMAAAGPIGMAAVGIGSLLKHKQEAAEMAKPTGATQQTQMISAANKKNATLSSNPAASQTIINNVDNSSKSNVQNQSQANIGPLIDHHTWIDGHRDHMR